MSSNIIINSSTHHQHQATVKMLTLLIIICSSLQLITLVSSFEFQVGEKQGWTVPPTNDTKLYNDWASEKRFKVGDSLRFKYRKDSVMEVSEAEYKKCNTTRPLFFSNTGNTIFSVDRPAIFYFISGASGHCDKGQRMIVKVLGHDDHDHHHSSPSSSSSANSVAMFSIVLLLFLSYSHLLF